LKLKFIFNSKIFQHVMRVKLGISFLIVYLLAFFLAPLLYYTFSDGNKKYSLFEVLYMEHLNDSICNNSDSEFQKIEKVFNYVSSHCHRPQNNENPVYSNAFQVNLYQSAYCDQQVLLMSKLLESLQIANETYYLFSPDSNISHTIMQAYFANNSIALDPFYHAFWAKDENNSATIQSLVYDSTIAMRYIPQFNYYRIFNKKGSKIKLKKRENLLNRNSIFTRWILLSNFLSADMLRHIICSDRNKKLFVGTVFQK
jgi:hypothetical protein